MEEKKKFTKGNEVVIFDYTNTDPRCIILRFPLASGS